MLTGASKVNGASWLNYLFWGVATTGIYKMATRQSNVSMAAGNPEQKSDMEFLSEQTPEYKEFVARLEKKLESYGKINHLGDGKYLIMELTSDGYKKLNLEATVLVGGMIVVPYRMYQGYINGKLKGASLLCIPLAIGLTFLYNVGSMTVRKVSVWPKHNSIHVEMGYPFAAKNYRFKIGEIDRDEPDAELDKELQRKLARQESNKGLSPDAAFAANRAKRKSSAQGECEYFIGNPIGLRNSVQMYIKKDPQFSDFKHDQDFFYKLFDPEFE